MGSTNWTSSAMPPSGVAVQVLSIGGMRAEAIRQGFPGIPVTRNSRRWNVYQSLASARPDSRLLVSSQPSRPGSS